tara:strand:- start:273 stop:899 length:627 start_codon:yes stop_codon:yes gene_type:complete
MERKFTNINTNNNNRNFDSTSYWENRYSNGGNSGRGSYNEIANYKAKIINNFIEKNNIKNLIDYGVGDGNQLSFLKCENIIGLDVSPTIIDQLKLIYGSDNTKQFYLVNNFNITNKSTLVISCEVLFHLINIDIWKKYITNLFAYSNKYIIIFAADYDKDYGNHCKCRKFTDYIKLNYQNWNLKTTIKKNDSCLGDFYIFEKISNKVD